MPSKIPVRGEYSAGVPIGFSEYQYKSGTLEATTLASAISTTTETEIFIVGSEKLVNGNTLLIDTEQLLITNIVHTTTDISDTLTFASGVDTQVNGGVSNVIFSTEISGSTSGSGMLITISSDGTDLSVQFLNTGIGYLPTEDLSISWDKLSPKVTNANAGIFSFRLSTALTVSRESNDTTAATHSTGALVSKYTTDYIPSQFGGTGYFEYLPNEVLIGDSSYNLKKRALQAGRGIEILNNDGINLIFQLNSEGLLSPATSTTLGGVIIPIYSSGNIPNGLTINATGNLTLKKATNEALGGVIPGGLDGGLKVDEATGVLSHYSIGPGYVDTVFPEGTPGAATGISYYRTLVFDPTGHVTSASHRQLPYATSDFPGLIKVGTGLSTNSSNQLVVDEEFVAEIANAEAVAMAVVFGG